MSTYETVVESENSNISAVMNVIPPHYRICKILHPNTSKSIPTNFIVFIGSVGVVRHVEANIFTVTDVTEPDIRLCSGTIHTNGSSN
jgi:hypothetical protein